MPLNQVGWLREVKWKAMDAPHEVLPGDWVVLIEYVKEWGPGDIWLVLTKHGLMKMNDCYLYRRDVT